MHRTNNPPQRPYPTSAHTYRLLIFKEQVVNGFEASERFRAISAARYYRLTIKLAQPLITLDFQPWMSRMPTALINSQQNPDEKKTCKNCKSLICSLVAGTGFEPVTFGL